MISNLPHGDLDTTYQKIQQTEIDHDIKISFVLLCGDVETIRNQYDLDHAISVPEKYKKMKDFHQYYSGQKLVPYLTIFIGGNHENSYFLNELPFGGFVCENFYYLGYAGVVNVEVTTENSKVYNLRISGYSGIYNKNYFQKGHFEKMPFDKKSNDVKSVYCCRSQEEFKLRQIDCSENSSRIDIFMSHDWPEKIEDFGDKSELLRSRPDFVKSIQENRFGNPAARRVLDYLKPVRWFSGHMHVNFEANVPFLDGKNCRFEALGKPTENCKFLPIQVVEENENLENVSKNSKKRESGCSIKVFRHDSLEPDSEVDVATDPEIPSSVVLKYDTEWLAIVKKTVNCHSTDCQPTKKPPKLENYFRYNFTPSLQEKEEILANFENNLEIYFPRDYIPTDLESLKNLKMSGQKIDHLNVNPQTKSLCSKLGILPFVDVTFVTDHFWQKFCLGS